MSRDPCSTPSTPAGQWRLSEQPPPVLTLLYHLLLSPFPHPWLLQESWVSRGRRTEDSLPHPQSCHCNPHTAHSLVHSKFLQAGLSRSTPCAPPTTVTQPVSSSTLSWKWKNWDEACLSSLGSEGKGSTCQGLRWTLSYRLAPSGLWMPTCWRHFLSNYFFIFLLVSLPLSSLFRSVLVNSRDRKLVPGLMSLVDEMETEGAPSERDSALSVWGLGCHQAASLHPAGPVCPQNPALRGPAAAGG